MEYAIKLLEEERGRIIFEPELAGNSFCQAEKNRTRLCDWLRLLQGQQTNFILMYCH